MDLLQPKTIQITAQDGTEKTFIISKFPAVQGREIITQYPVSAIPKLGDYKINEALMLKLMAFVAVPVANGQMTLSTLALVNNHCPDWEVLAKLEAAMIEYNCSFFQNGRASTFFDAIARKIPQKILETWMALQAQSSQKDAPPSTS